MQIPRRKSEELKKRDDGPIYLTEEGFQKLKGELAGLKRALPERIAETARTAAFGDRSDNAEYKAAKGILRRTHYRIFEIEDEIKRVVLIKPNVHSHKVQLGSTVVVEVQGAKKTYQILGSKEVDPIGGRISYQSPLGIALMNRMKGDTVTVPTKNGAHEYTILEIK